MIPVLSQPVIKGSGCLVITINLTSLEILYLETLPAIRYKLSFTTIKNINLLSEITLLSEMDPLKFSQDISSYHWKQDMTDELNQINRANTWSLLNPQGLVEGSALIGIQALRRPQYH